MLAIHPEYQDRLVAELHNVFNDADEPVTKEHIAKLREMDLVLKETMRLYHPFLTLFYSIKKIRRSLFVKQPMIFHCLTASFQKGHKSFWACTIYIVAGNFGAKTRMSSNPNGFYLRTVRAITPTSMYHFRPVHGIALAFDMPKPHCASR